MSKYLTSTLWLSLGCAASLLSGSVTALEVEEPLIPNNSITKSESRAKSSSWFQETSTSEYSSVAAEKTPLTLQIDRYLSPTVGANLMMSIHQGYKFLDDSVFISTEGDASWFRMAARFGNLLFIQGSVVGLEMIAQHEVFGHGYRLREFKVPGRGYRVTPWSGWASFNGLHYIQLPLSEQIAVSSGGMEATSILAKEIRTSWLDTQTIDSRDAQLYLYSSLDQTQYILDAKRSGDKTFAGGHDVIQYINDVNKWHQKPILNTHRLRHRAMIDFLDPFFFYSLYSLGQYVVEGSHHFEYPMISIGEFKYLPLMRTALAPYGSEYQFINLIKSSEYILQATLRYGNNGGKHSNGLGLEIDNFFKYDLLRIGAKLDFWSQPKLYSVNAASAKDKIGGAFSLIGRFRVLDKLDLVGQAGYKTTGFMQGEALKHSPIIRFGIAAYL